MQGGGDSKSGKVVRGQTTEDGGHQVRVYDLSFADTRNQRKNYKVKKHVGKMGLAVSHRMTRQEDGVGPLTIIQACYFPL